MNKKKYTKLKSDVSKIIIAVKRARYGDFHTKLSDLNTKEFEIAVNKLLEAIYDRELMIKEYQNALSKKNLSLEEILKQEKQLQLFKEEFIATLTHDMKVPVIAELNSLNFLLEGRFGEISPKQTEILNLMKASNQELKDLIENMLETYKLEQKNIELNIQEHNLNNFLSDVAKEMTPIILKTNHNVIVDLKNTENLTTKFDTFQLKRVIKNLIQNAITFSSPSTEIKLTTLIKDKEIKILCTNIGTSISEEDLKLIFDKYYSRHSKFRKAGTGLGLYLSQQIMLAHNGSISVDNSTENITTFIVKLPLI